MKHPVVAAAIASLSVCAVCGAAAPMRSASVMTIWRLPAPQSADAAVQALEAGVVAVNFLAPQLAALARHPGAKVTLAVDPVFLDALGRAAAGQSVLTDLALGRVGASDARASEMLDVLSSDVVPSANAAATAAGRRFTNDASAARLALMGDAAARFSQRDDVDYAATAVLLSLESSGSARAQTVLLKKNVLTNRDLQAVAAQFARASHEIVERTKKAATSGSVELAALPAYEPIMPLIIDAGGRTHNAPNTVALAAGADAGYAVDEGMRAVRALDSMHGDPGVVSPSGAYDDETAALLQAHHAAYGIFSERVVKTNAGASAQSVAETHAAAFRAYLLETSKTNKLPILFCSDVASGALDSQPASAPATAMGDRLAEVVGNALSSAPADSPPVVVFCLSAIGGVLRRVDRVQAIDHLAAVLARGGAIRAATPKEFLGQHPPSAQTYGYEPGSEAGGFDLWMGSANQASLWSALADARKAAGAAAALEKKSVRVALLQAESGRWYMTLALPQPRYPTDQSLARFRSLIAEIYRAAGKAVPSAIAPVKLEAPVPASTPTG